MILAGDVGGTKVVLALFDETDDVLRGRDTRILASRNYQRFEDLLIDYARDVALPPLRAACFAAAGAVVDGRVHTTNLPWILDARTLAEMLHVQQVRLMNDLEATAHGVLALAPDEFVVLNAGAAARRGTVAVIAAGTGLGEAIVFWEGERYYAIPSEGGHVDFAPRTASEINLLRTLQSRHGHVSYERVLSGPGLHTIYRFLRDSGGIPEPEWLTRSLAVDDPSATIARLALDHQDEICVAAVDMFCSIYGAEAGNLALKCFAVEVAVAGGIAPKILPALTNGTFMRAFTDKGRFADHLQHVTVRVVLNPQTALLGAARGARGES